MQITAIQPQQRSAERVNVHVDGEFRVALALELVLAAGLHVGDEVSEARLAELAQRDVGWKAREAAYNLLAVRPRTASELRQRLRRKEYPPEVVEEVVEALVANELLDDAEFAGMFARDRVRLKPKGPRRLLQELRARGVDAETADAAVAEAMAGAGVDETELAREAAARWAPRRGEDADSARRRLYGFLARRGFGSDAIREALEERLPRA